MNYLRKRAEDLLTQVALTPEAVDAMVAFAAERVAAERDASKETAERNKWMCEAMQEEIARLRKDVEILSIEKGQLKESLATAEAERSESAAQLDELDKISDALGTNGGHTSVAHIKALRKLAEDV